VYDKDAVRVIELARAEKRNAMLPEMLDQLHEAIVAEGSHRAMVLLGQGKTFCAGFDLKTCAADPSGDTMRA
ncbi:MAG: enoyl-CoA hydratase/isomerase family protein, partial [Erythrobacter sp.]|nr:enoyl-CoA hydratase/isomerase family protein [Erythrobacter sp.]